MDFIDKYLKKSRNLLDYKSSGREDSVILRKTGCEVVFPVENPILMQKLLKGFDAEDRPYDFTLYDQSLESTWLDVRRVEMILMRLKDPVDMPADRQARLRARIEEALPKIVPRIAEAESGCVLHLLMELGFFTKENVDSYVETLGACGARELMADLMVWKNRTFGSTDFDFSL